MHQRLVTYFRPNFDARAAIAWLIGTAYLAGVIAVSGLGRGTALAMLGVCLGMLGMRIYQARAHINFKLALMGTKAKILPAANFVRQIEKLKGDIFLGWGYNWEQKHRALTHEIFKRNADEIYPEPWLLKIIGREFDKNQIKGHPWVMALDEAKDIRIPIKHLEGHIAVMAVTGAIKTVLARLLVTQFAQRGDVVLMFDPKGDKDLKAAGRDACRAAGRERKFVSFHPAFADESFRFDALNAWDRAAQVASRIQMIMSADEDSNFVQFVWTVVTNIVCCMARVGEKVTIRTLLQHVQSQTTAEELLERTIDHFLQSKVSDYEARVKRQFNESDKPAAFSKSAQKVSIQSARLRAMIEYVKGNFSVTEVPSEIQGLIGHLEANREWFSKMVIALTPILTKLTAGDLGSLFSPDYMDIDDKRPIFTSRALIDGGYCAYIGVDALSDASTASAMVAMWLSEMCAACGDMYNYGGNKSERRIFVLIDEWGDALCEPVIQLANKARGVKVILCVLGQTMSDLIDKLGSREKAYRVLGNMNNLIVGATSDPDTLELLGRKIGETVINSVSKSQSSGQRSEDAGLEFSEKETQSNFTSEG
jgi:conjugal transfer pilus assembly protein TraD